MVPDVVGISLHQANPEMVAVPSTEPVGASLNNLANAAEALLGLGVETAETAEQAPATPPENSPTTPSSRSSSPASETQSETQSETPSTPPGPAVMNAPATAGAPAAAPPPSDFPALPPHWGDQLRMERSAALHYWASRGLALHQASHGMLPSHLPPMPPMPPNGAPYLPPTAAPWLSFVHPSGTDFLARQAAASIHMEMEQPQSPNSLQGATPGARAYSWNSFSNPAKSAGVTKKRHQKSSKYSWCILQADADLPEQVRATTTHAPNPTPMPTRHPGPHTRHAHAVPTHAHTRPPTPPDAPTPQRPAGARRGQCPCGPAPQEAAGPRRILVEAHLTRRRSGPRWPEPAGAPMGGGHGYRGACMPTEQDHAMGRPDGAPAVGRGA